jgi:hypothetical protein
MSGRKPKYFFAYKKANLFWKSVDNILLNMITVEALNWKTKEQCLLPEIPTGLRIHSGTVLYGTPVICGGLNYEVPQGDCYKLKEEDGIWESVSFRFFHSYVTIEKIKLLSAV